MTVFLPLSTNYHLYYEENEINNLVKEQAELNFTDYNEQIVNVYIFSYITALACSVFVLWLKC